MWAEMFHVGMESRIIQRLASGLVIKYTVVFSEERRMIKVTPKFLEFSSSISTHSSTSTRDANTGVANTNRYQIQSKRVSQLIAFIWRYLYQKEDIEKYQIAKELDNYFKHPQSLKDLLYAKNDTEPWKLMTKVFPDLSEPLFDSQADGIEYEIEVDVEQFRTSLEDPRFGDRKWRAIVGYPPRPFISDEGQLTIQELDEWINNTDDSKYVADNPFIPLCCS